MAFGCESKLAPLHLNVPGILMNGVCLYSFDTGQFHDVKVIDHSLIDEIGMVFLDGGCNALFYAHDGDRFSIFHTSEPSGADARYLSPNAFAACREIRQVTAITEAVKSSNVLCVAAIGPPEKITAVFHRIRKLPDLETALYPYHGKYCLEVFDHTAGKANAAKKLKRRLHASELTVFGGLPDDISMMEAADYCFAPRSGADEARKVANGLIESCDEDGVARFIQLRHGL
jgi:hydroxymethylpyrimidine pyrophosphatase-like HAD family hydrolase